MQEIRSLSNGLGELDNLITLASIIQKEATDLENMKMVSSVFHNRLNNSGSLRICNRMQPATISAMTSVSL